jgi:hypothetical protein
MSEPSSPAPAKPSRSDPTLWAILAGICALSPIPFIDDLFIGAIRRRVLGRIFQAHGAALTWSQRRALTRGHRGCLVGCLVAVVVYPVRKIFRKIFYFLAVKEAVDVASRLLHESWLVEHALSRGCLDLEELAEDKEPLARLNLAIHLTCEEVDTSPVNQILRRSFAGSRVFMRGFGRQLIRTLRAMHFLRKQDVGSDLPQGYAGEKERDFASELSLALKGEGSYLAGLKLRFDQRWAVLEEVEGSPEPEVAPEAEIPATEMTDPGAGEE